MKGKTILILTAVISTAVFIFVSVCVYRYSFLTYIGHFVAPLFLSSLVALLRYKWIDTQTKLLGMLGGLSAGVILAFTVLSRDFCPCSIYKILLWLAGCGLFWLIWRCTRPKNEEKQQQTNQHINE